MSLETVHQGRDGWLFLVGGSNQVLDLYRSNSTFTPKIAEAWVELLESREAKLARQGIQYLHLPAPEKLTIMHRYYDGVLEDLDASPIRHLASRHAHRLSCMMNPIEYLTRRSEELLLYWKTDTHWSAWGCFCAYQLLCARLGVKANETLLQYPYGEGEVTLDLGSKLPTPTSETARYYDLSKHAERVHANSLVQFKEQHGLVNEGSLHVGSHVVFRNDSDSALPQKVVLFGDSFSEYRPQLLTGMLAETFREVHFIWNASVDFDYVSQVKPDIVITELAERFMTRVPVDNLSIEKLARQRLEEYRRARA